MTNKKIIISILALISISIALFSAWQWGKTVEEQPVRQDQEIR